MMQKPLNQNHFCRFHFCLYIHYSKEKEKKKKNQPTCKLTLKLALATNAKILRAEKFYECLKKANISTKCITIVHVRYIDYF